MKKFIMENSFLKRLYDLFLGMGFGALIGLIPVLVVWIKLTVISYILTKCSVDTTWLDTVLMPNLLWGLWYFMIVVGGVQFGLFSPLLRRLK